MPYGLPLSWSVAVALLLHSLAFRMASIKVCRPLGKCYYNSTHIQDCLCCPIPRSVQVVYLLEAIAISTKHLRKQRQDSSTRNYINSRFLFRYVYVQIFTFIRLI
jgi:hypothetical protein